MSKTKRYAVFTDTVRGIVNAVDNRVSLLHKDAISTSNVPPSLLVIKNTKEKFSVNKSLSKSGSTVLN